MTYHPPLSSVKAPAYRWVVLFFTWLAFLINCVDRVAWSTVAAPVGHSLGIAVALLGAFVTAFYIGYVIANIIGGLITDTVGGRVALVGTMILLSIATFGFSYTTNLTTGITLQLIMGVAAGADYAAGVKIISSWFGKDRGRALGFYSTATSLAVVCANAIVPRIAAAAGWQTAFQAIGVITFVLAIVCFMVLRDSPNKIVQPRVPMSEILTMMKSPNIILLSLAGFGALWATVGFTSWANSLMTKQYGIDPITAGSIIALFGVGAMFAKPFLGWLTDVIGDSVKLLSVACLLGFAIMLMVWSRCSTVREFYIVAPFLGCVAFGYTPVLLSQITRISGARAAGASAGLTNAVWQAGAILSPLAVGKVYATSHSFMYALATLTAGPLIGAALMLFVKRGEAAEESLVLSSR